MDFFNRLWDRGQGLIEDLEKYRRKIRKVEIKFSASNLQLSDNGTATVTLTALIIRTWPFYSNFLGDNERVVWGGGMRNQNGGSVVIENPDRISTRAVISNWTGTRRFTVEVRDENGVKRAEGEIVVTAAQNSNAALILNVDFTDAQYSPNRSWEQNFPQGSEPRRYPGRPIPGEPIGDGLGILDEQLLLIKRNNRPGEYSQYMAIPDRMRLCRFIGRPDINYGLWRNKKFKLHVDFVCEDFMTEETVFVFTDYWPSYGYEDEKATEVGTESIVNPKWSWGFCKIKLQNGNIYGRIMKRLESRFNHTDLRREENGYRDLGSFSPFQKISLVVTLKYNVGGGRITSENLSIERTDTQFRFQGNRENHLIENEANAPDDRNELNDKTISLQVYRNTGSLSGHTSGRDLRILKVNFQLEV